jgi:hypothetical protein
MVFVDHEGEDSFQRFLPPGGGQQEKQRAEQGRWGVNERGRIMEWGDFLPACGGWGEGGEDERKGYPDIRLGISSASILALFELFNASKKNINHKKNQLSTPQTTTRE